MVNQLQKKNNIDTSVFVLKTEYNTDKSDSEKKIGDAEKRIPKISELVKKKMEKKIPNISALATSAVLPAVESKIPNVSNLVK